MPSPKGPSAKVLARRGAQIVMNRAALDAAQLGMADGLLEIGDRIIAEASARAPRDPATAQARGVPMMADTGVVSVWALGKLVHGGTERAASAYKPKVKVGERVNEAGQTRSVYRAVKVPKDQAVLFVGFASPLSHLIELGTVKMIARPFFSPAFNANVGGAARTVPVAIGKRVKAVP